MPEISKKQFESSKDKSKCSCWYSFTYKLKNALFCLWPEHCKQEKVYKAQAKELWNQVEEQRRNYVENQLNTDHQLNKQTVHHLANSCTNRRLF
jgi:hypothetical protein